MTRYLTDEEVNRIVQARRIQARVEAWINGGAKRETHALHKAWLREELRKLVGKHAVQVPKRCN